MSASVSVVVPAYNAAPYLGAALDSILAQGVPDLEIIVVDDGSTDDTGAVASRYGDRVRYLRQDNAGVSAARNRGIAASTGRRVAFLDADDTWLPGKLRRQQDVLAAEPSVRLVYSAFTVVDEDLRPLEVRRSRRVGSALSDLLLLGNVVGSICTVLCDRALLDEVGGFDLTLSQCADWDLWVRLAALTEFAYVDEPLVTYRQHATNMSRQVRLLEHDSNRLLEKGFARADLPPGLQARRRQAFARNWMVLAGSYLHAGQPGAFLRCLAKSLALDPAQAAYPLRYPVRRLRAWRER